MVSSAVQAAEDRLAF